MRAALRFFPRANATLAQTLGSAFHVPDSTEVGGTHMRNPEFEIATSTSVNVYSGNPYQNGTNPGNQTGGYLFYRGATQSTWKSATLQYDSVIGDYKYWRATFSSKGIGVDDVIQYYLEVTYSDHTTTFVYGGDAASQTTATQATAAASPFTIRNRASYIYHNDNRAISGSNVTFTAKVGYVGKDGTTASRWVDNGAIYYTIDGSLPVGSLGVAGTTSTTVLPLAFSQIVSDPSVAGNAMNWTVTAALPMYTQIRYLVGFWNSANDEEKFGDYNTTGTNKEAFSFSNGTVATPSLTVNGVSADYTVTHVFINEISGDQSPLTILFDPVAAGPIPRPCRSTPT